MVGYLVIACFLGVAAAAPYGAAVVDTVSIPRYEFNYAVRDPYTGDNKAQTEVRNGGVVRGSYSLAEADGTLRVVDYAADPLTGFNANVRRIGTAVHPPTVVARPVVAPVVAPIAPIVAPVARIAPIAPIAPISNAYLGSGLGLGGYNGYLGASNLGLSAAHLGLGSANLGLAAYNLGGYNLGLGRGLGYNLGYGH